MKNAKRPSLERLAEMPPELLELELEQILVEAEQACDGELVATARAIEPGQITPALIGELHARLRGAAEQAATHTPKTASAP